VLERAERIAAEKHEEKDKLYMSDQQFAHLVRRSGQSLRDRLRNAKAIQNSHVFLELYPEFVPCKQNGDLMEKLKHKNSGWNKPTKTLPDFVSEFARAS